MHFIRILLSIVFVLFASTALAAKPEKMLVCHVGNELGSNGETYLDNPNCDIQLPYDGDPADYICPDAGKVDLILVSKKAKHIDNDAHSFLDDTGYLWEDYSPEEGVGDEAADYEGGDLFWIDAGCELPEENLACPCWNRFTESELVALMNLGSPTDPTCRLDIDSRTWAFDGSRLYPQPNVYFDWSLTIYAAGPVCFLRLPLTPHESPILLTEDEAVTCGVEALDVVSQITWCPD